MFLSNYKLLKDLFMEPPTNKQRETLMGLYTGNAKPVINEARAMFNKAKETPRFSSSEIENFKTEKAIAKMNDLQFEKIKESVGKNLTMKNFMLILITGIAVCILFINIFNDYSQGRLKA
jgi:DNA phosphorothioation-dependent restriction protein DptG